MHSFPDQSSDEEYEENFIESKGVASRNEESDDESVDNDDDDDDQEAVLKSNMSWKDNLAQKAREAYLDRHSNTDNLMKLVYGVFSMVSREHFFFYFVPLLQVDSKILLFFLLLLKFSNPNENVKRKKKMRQKNSAVSSKSIHHIKSQLPKLTRY